MNFASAAIMAPKSKPRGPGKGKPLLGYRALKVGTQRWLEDRVAFLEAVLAEVDSAGGSVAEAEVVRGWQRREKEEARAAALAALPQPMEICSD